MFSLLCYSLKIPSPLFAAKINPWIAKSVWPAITLYKLWIITYNVTSIRIRRWNCCRMLALIHFYLLYCARKFIIWSNVKNPGQVKKKRKKKWRDGLSLTWRFLVNWILRDSSILRYRRDSQFFFGEFP